MSNSACSLGDKNSEKSKAALHLTLKEREEHEISVSPGTWLEPLKPLFETAPAIIVPRQTLLQYVNKMDFSTDKGNHHLEFLERVSAIQVQIFQIASAGQEPHLLPVLIKITRHFCRPDVSIQVPPAA